MNWAIGCNLRSIVQNHTSHIVSKALHGRCQFWIILLWSRQQTKFTAVLGRKNQLRESCYCHLITTKATNSMHTTIFMLLCLLQGMAQVNCSFCFVHQVCWEINQATSSLLSWPRKTWSSTWFLITAPQSSILHACQFRGSIQRLRLERSTVILHLSGTVNVCHGLIHILYTCKWFSSGHLLVS